MDTGSTDARLREAFRQMAPAIDATSFFENLEAKLAPTREEQWSLTASAVEQAGGQERGSVPRRRSGLRVAVFASIAVVLVAAVAVGSLEAVKHLGKGTPIVYITDQTTVPSTSSSAAASETPAAMFRGNLERTGSTPVVDPKDRPSWYGSRWAVGPRPSLAGWCMSVVLQASLVSIVASTSMHWTSRAARRNGSQRAAEGPRPSRAAEGPRPSRGLVYFGSNDGYLYAVDVRSGQEKWKFKTAGEVLSSPAVSDGVVYFGSVEQLSLRGG